MSWNQLSTDHFLNGMIFVCDSSTYDEMFQHQIFGLPISYIREMKNLVPYRSALFLLEKHTSLLKGVFIPTCKAKKNIKNDLWEVDGESQFPSQIRFTLYCTMPSIPKESWHLPNFIRLSKSKAKFLDGLRVQMLLQAFQKYEMSNRMMIEQTFQQNIPNQYITTTILPPLRGDPTHRQIPNRHAASPTPYGPPLPPMHHANALPPMHHANVPAIAPTPPPFYAGNEADDRQPFSNEINEELINALKTEIDLLRVENAYMRTKDHPHGPPPNHGRPSYTREDLFGDYHGEEIMPYQPPLHTHAYPPHPPHEMKMMDHSFGGRGRGYYPHV